MTQYTSENVNKVEDLDPAANYRVKHYLQWKFDEMVELIRGKLHPMSPAPSTSHQLVSNYLVSLWYSRVRNDNCRLFSAPTDLYLLANHNNWQESNTVVQPDLFIVCDNAKIIEAGCVGTPDFVVEILSPKTRDKNLNAKKTLYHQAAVPEYWAIDLKEQFILVFRWQQEKFIESVFRTGKLATAHFPKLKLNIQRLFEEAHSK